MVLFCQRTKNKMFCLICKKEFKSLRSLSIHIKPAHNITLKEYYDDYLKKEFDGICKTCGKNTSFGGLTKGYYDFCSSSCASKNFKVREKTKKTVYERFGVDNPSKSKEIQNKKKVTWLKNYGVDNPSKSNEIKKKIIEVNIQKYGTKCSLQNNKVKRKIKDTCRKRYGVDSYQKTEKFKTKIIKTCQNKYGVDNVFQLDFVKEKSKKTSRKKYGTDYPMQSDKIQKRLKNSNLLKFGVDNYSKTDEARELFRNNFINRIENQELNGEPLTPRVGIKERECLQELQKHTKYKILRQEKIHGFFPDGYVRELNLIIEFYEKWHSNNWAIKKDQYREKFLKNKIKCDFFIITEEEWVNNQNKIIQKFTEVIKCL